MEGQEPQAGSSRQLGANEDASEISTLKEFLALPENKDATLVVPIAWCPHLEQVKSCQAFFKEFRAESPCLECQNTGENWICLSCFEVHCSRYVNEHMLLHGIEKEHPLSISIADLSIWCYACESYVDNKVLYDVKNNLHKLKFGVELPQVNEINIEMD